MEKYSLLFFSSGLALTSVQLGALPDSYPSVNRPVPQRAGMVTTGAAALGAVSAILKRFMSCRNTCLERRSLSLIQNQVLR